MTEVIALLVVNRPGENFGELQNILLEAGIVTAEQLLLLPEDVLCVIGDMGQARARILRNYAKRVVLPLMGLRGNYEEPELVVDSDVKEHRRSHQETGAESTGDIVDILESASEDGDDKDIEDDKDNTWVV